MPTILSESWGRTLSESFDDSPTEDENEGPQLLDILGPDALIEYAETTDIIPLAALQDICQLAQTPTHLRAFKDSEIVPSLMRSLRMYCESNQVSFCAIGFGCAVIINQILRFLITNTVITGWKP